jgi:hypothetical protein
MYAGLQKIKLLSHEKDDKWHYYFSQWNFYGHDSTGNLKSPVQIEMPQTEIKKYTRLLLIMKFSSWILRCLLTAPICLWEVQIIYSKSLPARIIKK